MTYVERRRFLRFLAIWGAWSVPAAFVTALSLREQNTLSWRMLAVEIAPWYYWALLTLPIVRFAHRYPAESLRNVAGVLRHVGMALLIGVGCGVLSVLLLIALDAGTAARTPAQLFFSAILFWCIFGLIFYSLITAIAFVLGAQRRLRERERTAAQLQARLVEAQLNGLRMQLQPHFLFNTLNTVAMYVREGDAATSIRVLSALSDLLRRVLDSEAQPEVTLRSELEQVERYLEIEALRFSDRLTISVDVPAELQDALVPNLSLQPIVENALRHGTAQRIERSRLSVRAARDSDQLTISVYNDGPQLAEPPGAENTSGIGVRNTRLRLQHLYGRRGRLELFNQDGGVVARMSLPYHV